MGLGSIWGDGRTEREFEEAGVACCTRRNPLGFRCGYAAVGPGHALYGADASAAHGAMPGLDVNGDLTFARGAGGLWVFGWDGGHSWNSVDPDLLDPVRRALYDGDPGWHGFGGDRDGLVVDADMAEEVTRRLARALAAVEAG